MKRIEHRKCFEGQQDVYQHESSTLKCSMNFGIFLPKESEQKRLPVLYWLSGLTCTEQNFMTKAGAQQFASKHGIILVIPDTSPRGENIPNDDAYDLGIGASFYLNATEGVWQKNFRMYDYIVNELPQLIEKNFPANDKKSIFGHSMGGHGALTIALKNPDKYQSVSAFSPIVAPSEVPWGQKAFSSYLGEDKETWNSYDTVKLIAKDQSKLHLLIDQGLNDEFLEKQLRPDLLQKICSEKNHPLTLNLREGYDHSYYFIASFIGEHIAYHAKALNN
jgi:S-formylglutathione hydrolase